MKKVSSIYRVKVYVFDLLPKEPDYPYFGLKNDCTVFYNTLEEAEQYVKHYIVSLNGLREVYAFVVSELPLGEELTQNAFGSSSLSERVYLPDGTLWRTNEYSTFMPRNYSTEEYEFWSEKKIFLGRAEEEFAFKPGDIVEIFGFDGNPYWPDREVNLGIVVEVPKSKEVLTKTYNEYIATHKGFEVSPVQLCYMFNSFLDEYKVLSLACDNIDHSQVIATFPPRREVPADIRQKLEELYRTQSPQRKS